MDCAGELRLAWGLLVWDGVGGVGYFLVMNIFQVLRENTYTVLANTLSFYLHIFFCSDIINTL